MDPYPIPDWVRQDPLVKEVKEWYLPPGSGISGPSSGAFLMDAAAENAIRPMEMWHILLHPTDQEIEELSKSRVLVLAVSVVPVFQVYPWDRTIEGEAI